MSIIEYIDPDIEKDVEDILNGININSCYKLFTDITPYGVNGANDILKIFDYTYLIPNLFRKCYLYGTLPIPNICISEVIGSVTSKNLPILLDEEFIKSFLYFNFPVNINYYYNINNYILNVVNFKYIISKHLKNATYGSFTTPNIVYNAIYSNNSILTNLLEFYSIIQNSSSNSKNQKISCSFKIPWEYTTGCAVTGSGTTYIVGVYNSNNIITQTTFDLLNYIQNSFFNNFTNTNINYNEILLVFKSNIFKVLGYALEVYQDILSMYDYLYKGYSYCQKDYMNVKNLPYLMKLYNNFYNNQIYTNEHLLPNSSVISINPTIINIETYVNNFKNEYIVQNKGQVLNTIIFNTDEALIICYSGISQTQQLCISGSNSSPNIPISSSKYEYYYVNINNPSAVKITNTTNTGNNTQLFSRPLNISGTPSQQSSLNSFQIQYFNGDPIKNITSYLSYANASSYQQNQEYLFASICNNTNFVPPYPPPLPDDNYWIARTYNVYNSNGLLNSKVIILFIITSSVAGSNINPGSVYCNGFIYYPLNGTL